MRPTVSPTTDHAPEHLTDRVADQPIQDPPGLLGLHQALVDGTWLLHGPLDGAASDLLKRDASDRVSRSKAQRGHKMPGDGFAFPIRVTGQQHGRGRASGSPELLDDAGLGGGYDILRREV